MNFNAGDRVRLRLAKDEIEGIFIDNPDSEIVLLKLDSGYNIGIKKENILGSRILKKFVEDKQKVKIKQNENLPKIGMIVTGGTIAAKLNSKTGGVSWLTDLNEFQKFYPEIFEIANVKRIEVPFMTSSEAMDWQHWEKIARKAEELLNDSEIKGIVITHGTDFLHYTASALSFFFKKLGKPVVLTYSQRSIDRASSDARLNLKCAARMALSDVAEVMLVGHADNNDDFCYAMRGTKVRKLHSSRRDAFRSVNEMPIAKVWEDRYEILSEYKKRTDIKSELDSEYSDKVALVKFYPGQDSSILDFYALKYKGVVIEVGGLGHLPVSEAGHNWIPKLKKYIKQGLIVCAAAQTVNGRLDPYVYSNGRELVEAGVIFLEDVLAETAFVKLGWVLGHYGWKKDVEKKMLENVAGEFNDRLLN